MTTITDEFMQARLTEARPYTVLILKKGPNYTAADARAVIWEHGRRNMQLQAEGLLPIVCPVMEEGDVAGVGVFAVDVQAATETMAADPAVQAGVLTFTVHTAVGFPGSSLP